MSAARCSTIRRAASTASPGDCGFTAQRVSAWLWIPVTVWAAFAQTVRNAAQRHLTTELGTLGATLVRFLYGLPFALAWLFIVFKSTAKPIPHANSAFIAWVSVGALTQIVATALLLRT